MNRFFHGPFHGAVALLAERQSGLERHVADSGVGRDQVLHALRANPVTADIPVVFLTARTSDADIWEGWKAGAAYYLTKPFDPDQLLHFVNQLFDTTNAR